MKTPKIFTVWMVSLVLLVGMPIATKTAHAASLTVKPVHVETTVEPLVYIGTTVHIKSTIKNLGTPDPILVDIEVKDVLGRKVAQKFYDNEIVVVGSPRTFAFDWTPSIKGNYKISVGLIYPGWSGLYGWTEGAARFTAEVPPAGSPPGHVKIPAKINIYSDAGASWGTLSLFSSNWPSWSWNTDLGTITSTKTEGPSALTVTYKTQWAGLYLYNDGVDTSHYATLVFSVNGGPTGGQELQLLGFDGSLIAMPPILLSKYLPQAKLLPNTWQTVRIPLADLKLAGNVITGIAIQDTTGGVAPTYYLDNIFIE